MHSQEYKNDLENHAYVITSGSASCTSDVISTLECEYCGHTKEEVVPASGHELVEQSRGEPDCTTDGFIVYKCETCGEEVTETIAAGHKLTELSKTEPTCTAAGSVTSKCDVCGEKVTEVIDALTHNMIEVSRQEATDYVDGEIVSKCEHCSEEIIEIIPCLIARGSAENPYVFDAQALFDLSVDGTSQTVYLDQWVNVTGTLLTISDYGDLKGYYLVGGPGQGVVCWVEGNDTNAQHGQVINFVGKVSVADTNHIEINECQIKSVSWPEEKLKSPVTISGWSSTMDFLGGVEWNFKLTNNSDKTIKYVMMEWACYNAVGDLVYDQFTRKAHHSVKYTGPLEPGKTTNTQRNTTLFYNHSYNSASLTKLQVEFMDGTVINITTQGFTDIIRN